MASSFPRLFNFWSHHQTHNHHHRHGWKQVAIGTVAAVAMAGSGAAAVIKLNDGQQKKARGLIPVLPFACLAEAQPASPFFTEPQTGVTFPESLADGAEELQRQQTLASTGLRKKCILGLKNITVYAYGVYSNEEGLKEQLGSKYEQQSVQSLKDNKAFYEDLIMSDFDLTVRLVIVYGRLKIGSIRSAFEESIGSRIKKYNGTENWTLLESFTSLFRDDIKLPPGTIIDISRQSGHILKTKVDGKELGAVQSPLLCRAFLDLYIGDEPFDVKCKEKIGSKLASVLGK